MVRSETHAKIVSVLKKEDEKAVVTLQLPNDNLTGKRVFKQVLVKNCKLIPGTYIKPNDIIGD